MKIDFNYLNSLGDGKKIAVYEVNVNDHLRFIAPYEGKFYVLFWLEISSDGSVCCGVRDLKAKKIYKWCYSKQKWSNDIRLE